MIKKKTSYQWKEKLKHKRLTLFTDNANDADDADDDDYAAGGMTYSSLYYVQAS